MRLSYLQMGPGRALMMENYIWNVQLSFQIYL